MVISKFKDGFGESGCGTRIREDSNEIEGFKELASVTVKREDSNCNREEAVVVCQVLHVEFHPKWQRMFSTTLRVPNGLHTR